MTEPNTIEILTSLQLSQEAHRQCALGLHAWVPWLELPNGSWTTWCAREGCKHEESYDL